MEAHCPSDGIALVAASHWLVPVSGSCLPLQSYFSELCRLLLCYRVDCHADTLFIDLPPLVSSSRPVVRLVHVCGLDCLVTLSFSLHDETPVLDGLDIA